MLIVRKIARGVGDHFHARASEWALTAILLLWGIILASPHRTFDGPAFAVLAAIAPEWLWATGCICVGLARLLALTVNGTFHDTDYSRWSPHVRAGMALLSSFFWLEIALSIWAGNPGAQGMAVYPVLLALDFFNAYRASRDAWKSDEDAKNAGSG